MRVSVDIGDLDIRIDDEARENFTRMVQNEAFAAARELVCAQVRLAIKRELQPVTEQVRRALWPAMALIVQRVVDGDHALTAKNIARMVLEEAVE